MDSAAGTAHTGRTILWVAAGIALCALGVAGAGMKIASLASDPDIALLCPEDHAQWIRFDEPVNLRMERPGKVVTGLRKRFTVDVVPSGAILDLRAMKGANVLLDGETILATTADLRTWKTEYQVDLVPRLAPGDHELRLVVLNENGPACALAYCEALGLFTGGDWEASHDGTTWTRALPVDDPRPAELSRLFPPAPRSLFGLFPVLIPLFGVVFAVSVGGRHARGSALRLRRLIPGAAGFRRLMIGAWVVLAVNNIGKIPSDVGFDIQGQAEYVYFIAQQGRLPLATDGWTMFQAPLFYMVSAVLYRVFTVFLSSETAWYLLRLVPLACGIAQVEIAYRALCHLWPEREDLQTAGTFIAGFLPMNLYMSQFIGNETLAGCLIGITVVLAFRILRNPDSGLTRRSLLVLGGVLGLALLSKVSAVFMVPPLALLLVLVSVRRAPTRTAAALGMVFGAAFLVCGWYYLRNWIELGRPAFGGWEPARGFVWWQYPGYRTPRQFYAFGQALIHPVCAGLTGFWDGIYSTLWADGYLSSMVTPDHFPPWNYRFLQAGVWLALAPALLIAAGIAAALRKPVGPAGQGGLFAACCLAVYLAGLMYAFLVVPFYCIVKASYTLGLTPCYAVLGAAGIDLVSRRPWLRAAVYGALACWGAAAYAAYFVL